MKGGGGRFTAGLLEVDTVLNPFDLQVDITTDRCIERSGSDSARSSAVL